MLANKLTLQDDSSQMLMGHFILLGGVKESYNKCYTVNQIVQLLTMFACLMSGVEAVGYKMRRSAQTALKLIGRVTFKLM